MPDHRAEGNRALSRQLARGGAACDDAVFERHSALRSDVLSSKVFRIGTKPGGGARTKLVNNLLAGINLAGTCEALALAERLGLDAARTLDAGRDRAIER